MNFKKGSIRRVVAALCATMSISAFAIAPVYSVEGPCEYTPSYCVVNAGTLNVRESASVDSPVLSVLPIGTTLRIYYTEPGWARVFYDPANIGALGYVSLDYVTVHDGEMPEYDATGGAAAVEVVKQYLGVPYVYGGTSPRGFDCSGLMQYVYAQLGYSINRVAADQMRNGVAISRENLAPGDLVGFYSSPGSGYVSHIGMYIGNGMMIHAPHTGDVVRVAAIDGTYYDARFAGGRRIIY